MCRLLLAATFILSGFVKAIDPLGTQYKIHDYLEAMGLTPWIPDWATLTASVILAAFEFALGIYLLFAIQRRVVSRIVTAVMVVMTALTLWIAVANPVKDCGCFGDAIVLTNTQTLIKNIILLACAVVIAKWPLLMARLISKSNQWIVRNYSVLFIFAIEVISLYTLPLFDFRPYHVGADLRKGMTIPPGAKEPQFETTFILKKNGETREFTLDNYPDSTWQFVDSHTVQTAEGYVPPIHDFSIELQSTGEDITQQVLNDKGYTFLLISPWLDKADDTNFGDIDQIYEYAQEQHIPFFCLTASSQQDINRWIDLTGAEYQFCITDATTLKTIIRSNPGLLLLKDGVVIRKWSHNRLPQTDELKGPLEKLPIGQIPDDFVPTKILKIFLWYILPLLLLTLADRTLAWTRWLKERNNSNILYKLFKKKRKMRKKIVAGNWKMNLNLQEGVALAKEINEALAADKPNCEVIICTPFIHLASVAKELDQNVVALGAENCADKAKGAFTGEVSGAMVASTGAKYVILGHSERRQYYHETSEILKEKVALAFENGLTPIFCIGEVLEERENGTYFDVVKKQVEDALFHLSADDFKKIILAYEPVWAIGTGKTATAEQAQEIHAFIRSLIAEKYGKEIADNCSILYGGSCKPSNAKELFANPDVDGGLIGGAALKVSDFKGIIDAFN